MAGMYWCVNKKTGQYIIMNSIVGGWINGILKMTACIYRPWVRSSAIKPVEEAMKTATGYSFPSGHTANATAIWGGIAVTQRKNKLLRNLMIILVLLIGFSRNFIGVHTPQDVLISLVIGVLLLWGTYHLMKWIGEDRKKDIWVLVACFIMCVAVVVYARLKSFPMDYVDGKLLVDPQKMMTDSWWSAGEIFGFGIGWFVERRWVNFSMSKNVGQRISQFIIGALILALINTSLRGLLSLIMIKEAALVISALCITLYIMVLFPMWIKASNKRREKLDESSDS